MAHRHYYAYNDDDDEPSSAWRTPLIVLAVLVVVAFLAVGGYWLLGTSENAPSTAASTQEPPSGSALVDSTESPTTTDASDTPATTQPPRLVGTGTSTTTSSTTTTQPADEAPHSTLPDGSAAPVVAIFDVDTITLAGAVPSQEARERLSALALANSKTPASIIDLLTIDPAVPESVGVRVVELTSERFPEGSAEIRMAHAAELNRLADVMSALPNVSALVVGHADQIGSEDNNFALSEERARAVVSYLVDRGVEPSRLSSRAVGESDLLSVNSDEASLALNRRTEFILYGLLVES
jgi:outer membrane protein OmpA-like peptidoglycan-associated protein